MTTTTPRAPRREQGRSGWKLPAAVAASLCAVILTASGATAAFATPASSPAQGPSAGPTAAPDPHSSMPGMDPDMPGMTHDEMPGMDPDMPGMTHDEMPGMDPDMPGMTHDETPGMDPDMPGMTGGGHTHNAPATSDARPQGAVVGGFALLNGGVLLAAGLMRRRARLSAAKPSRSSRPAK